MSNKNIQPNFKDLSISEPFKNEVNEFDKNSQPKKHVEILNDLLGQIEPIDFKAIAYPNIEFVIKRIKKLGIKINDSENTDKTIYNLEKSISEDHPESEALSIELNKLKKLKLTNKHYTVISIDNVLKVAKNNNWGLCRNNDFIYLYNGEYWANIETDDLKMFLGKASQKMGVEKIEAKYHVFKDNLQKQFLSSAYRPAPTPPKEVVNINLKNGTFEISPKGNRLKSFEPSDFITYQLPFDYDPEAKAPIFQNYLNEVLPDPDKQKIIAEYLGYIFIKDRNYLKLEKVLILFGTGANGKSVLFEVINELLGAENVSNYNLHSLTEEKGYYRAKLVNKLVNYCSELSTKLNTSIFKSIASCEPVEACLKYGQPFTMENYAKLIFNANELPKEVEHSDGFFRRFLIVPFDVTIPEHQQDKQLAKKIIESELSGVFNWILDGLQRLIQQKKFSECEAVKQALESYKTESNSIKQFINEYGYKADPENFVLLKELYSDYKVFCIEDGMTAFKKINFSKQLKAMNFQFDRQSGTGQNIIYVSKQF